MGGGRTGCHQCSRYGPYHMVQNGFRCRGPEPSWSSRRLRAAVQQTGTCRTGWRERATRPTTTNLLHARSQLATRTYRRGLRRAEGVAPRPGSSGSSSVSSAGRIEVGRALRSSRCRVDPHDGRGHHPSSARSHPVTRNRRRKVRRPDGIENSPWFTGHLQAGSGASCVIAG